MAIHGNAVRIRAVRVGARCSRVAGSGLLWLLVLCARPVFADDPGVAAVPDAKALISRAIDRTRGLTSHAILTMRIVRPSWQRETTLEAWTRGREDALIRFTAPARDRGNATLKLGDRMWTFTPRLNRSMRLPASLMSQSWAGSDFSYEDLSRTDNLLQHYALRLGTTSERDGHRVFEVIAEPRADAPVVWGREVILIRDDDVVLAHSLFDQDMQPVKALETLEVGTLSGRTFGTRSRMQKVDTPQAWTEITWQTAAFDLGLPDDLFTLFSLQHGQADGDHGS